MKKRSTFEWALIGLLAALFLGAGVGFAYLLQQFQASPAAATPRAAAIAEASADLLSMTAEGNAATLASQTPTLWLTPTSTRKPTPTLRPTSTRTGALPSHFVFGRPLADPAPFWPLTDLRYGSGTNYSSRAGVHTGLDYLGDYGTPVYALGPGEVIWEGYGIESYLGPDNAYGVAVSIKHDVTVYDMSVYSIYGHLSVTHVLKGDRVKEGDLIGEIGLTGNTTGPHLHLEVRLGNDSEFVSRNPELYIRPLPGYGVLAARLLNTDGSNLYGQELYLESLADHRTWTVNSYASGVAIPDAIFKENLVIGDLPAGQYAIIVYYGGAELHHSVIIHPGEVTYFTLTGFAGYMDGLPGD
jgi:murein DD-endopeptidase MepM/ murein hydrolase activator NlpD